MDILIELINNVGFPVAVSIALFYQNMKVQDMNMQTFKEFKTVVDRNSNTLKSLEITIREMVSGKDV